MIAAKPLSPFDRVEAARARVGLSQKELCRRAKLAPNTLAQAKSVGGNLSIASLQAIAPVLGSTVSELLGEAPPAAVPTAAGGPHIQPVNLAWIHPSPLNPRQIDFKDKDEAAAIDELAASIVAQGVLQPLLLRPRNDGGAGFLIVFGERRYHAAKKAGFETVPAEIREMSDAEHLEIALVENGQRLDVPPLQEAEGFAKLQALDPKKWTAGEIARRLGKSPRHVQLRLALVNHLAVPTKQALADGDITLAHARVIAELRVPAKRQQDYVKVLRQNGDADIDPMTAEDLREWILDDLTPVEKAIFDVEASGLETFSVDDSEGTYFRDRDAFLKKQKAAVDRKVKELAATYKWVKVVNSYSSYDYAKATDKAKSGCVIEFNPHTGGVQIHTGVVKAGSANAAKPKARTSSGAGGTDYKARNDAEDAMKTVLQGHAGTTAREAALLLIFCTLGDYAAGLPSFWDADGIDKDIVDRTGLRAMKRHLVAHRDVYIFKKDVDLAAAWRTLASIENDLLIPALGEVIASQLQIFDLGAGSWLLAQELGLKLPEKHDAVWRKALAGKVPGIQLDLEDAKPAKRKAAE